MSAKVRAWRRAAAEQLHGAVGAVSMGMVPASAATKALIRLQKQCGGVIPEPLRRPWKAFQAAIEAAGDFGYGEDVAFAAGDVQAVLRSGYGPFGGAPAVPDIAVAAPRDEGRDDDRVDDTLDADFWFHRGAAPAPLDGVEDGQDEAGGAPGPAIGVEAPLGGE